MCDGRNRRNEWDRCDDGIEQEDAITGLELCGHNAQKEDGAAIR